MSTLTEDAVAFARDLGSNNLTQVEGLLGNLVAVLRNHGKSDLLNAYIKQSPLCTELFNAWANEDAREMLKMMSYIMEVFAYVVEGHFDSSDPLTSRTRSAVANRILTERLGVIYRFLQSDRDHTLRVVLRILTGIVSSSPALASNLARNFNFKLEGLHRLPRRRAKNAGKGELKYADVRGCFIKFALSFFQWRDPNIAAEILGLKGFLSFIVAGLKDDDSSRVLSVLSTMEDQILDHRHIPRNSKLFFFNDFVLKRLCTLTKSGDQTVKVAVASFLKKLCTDTFLFRSPQAKLLLDVCLTLKPFQEAQQELILAILRVHPAVLSGYLCEFNPSFQMTGMTWSLLRKLRFFLKLVELDITLLRGKVEASDRQAEQSTEERHIAWLSHIFLPAAFRKSYLTQALYHQDRRVVFAVLLLLRSAFRRVKRGLDEGVVDRQSPVVDALMQQILLSLPTVDIFLSIWQKLLLDPSIEDGGSGVGISKKPRLEDKKSDGDDPTAAADGTQSGKKSKKQKLKLKQKAQGKADDDDKMAATEIKVDMDGEETVQDWDGKRKKSNDMGESDADDDDEDDEEDDDDDKEVTEADLREQLGGASGDSLFTTWCHSLAAYVEAVPTATLDLKFDWSKLLVGLSEALAGNSKMTKRSAANIAPEVLPCLSCVETALLSNGQLRTLPVARPALAYIEGVLRLMTAGTEEKTASVGVAIQEHCRLALHKALSYLDLFGEEGSLEVFLWIKHLRSASDAMAGFFTEVLRKASSRPGVFAERSLAIAKKAGSPTKAAALPPSIFFLAALAQLQVKDKVDSDGETAATLLCEVTMDLACILPQSRPILHLAVEETGPWKGSSGKESARSELLKKLQQAAASKSSPSSPSLKPDAKRRKVTSSTSTPPSSTLLEDLRRCVASGNEDAGISNLLQLRPILAYEVLHRQPQAHGSAYQLMNTLQESLSATSMDLAVARDTLVLLFEISPALVACDSPALSFVLDHPTWPRLCNLLDEEANQNDDISMCGFLGLALLTRVMATCSRSKTRLSAQKFCESVVLPLFGLVEVSDKAVKKLMKHVGTGPTALSELVEAKSPPEKQTLLLRLASWLLTILTVDASAGLLKSFVSESLPTFGVAKQAAVLHAFLPKGAGDKSSDICSVSDDSLLLSLAASERGELLRLSARLAAIESTPETEGVITIASRFLSYTTSQDRLALLLLSLPPEGGGASKASLPATSRSESGLKTWPQEILPLVRQQCWVSPFTRKRILGKLSWTKCEPSVVLAILCTLAPLEFVKEDDEEGEVPMHLQLADDPALEEMSMEAFLPLPPRELVVDLVKYQPTTRLSKIVRAAAGIPAGEDCDKRDAEEAEATAAEEGLRALIDAFATLEDEEKEDENEEKEKEDKEEKEDKVEEEKDPNEENKEKADQAVARHSNDNSLRLRRASAIAETLQKFPSLQSRCKKTLRSALEAAIERSSQAVATALGGLRTPGGDAPKAWACKLAGDIILNFPLPEGDSGALPPWLLRHAALWYAQIKDLEDQKEVTEALEALVDKAWESYECTLKCSDQDRRTLLQASAGLDPLAVAAQAGRGGLPVSPWSFRNWCATTPFWLVRTGSATWSWALEAQRLRATLDRFQFRASLFPGGAAPGALAKRYDHDQKSNKGKQRISDAEVAAELDDDEEEHDQEASHNGLGSSATPSSSSSSLLLPPSGNLASVARMAMPWDDLESWGDRHQAEPYDLTYLLPFIAGQLRQLWAEQGGGDPQEARTALGPILLSLSTGGVIELLLFGCALDDPMLRACVMESLSIIWAIGQLWSDTMLDEEEEHTGSVRKLPFRELPLVVWLLKFARNSFAAPDDEEDENAVPKPLSRLVASFLSASVAILFQQTHSLYREVTMALGGNAYGSMDVPRFHQVLLGQHSDCLEARHWLLRVLRRAVCGGDTQHSIIAGADRGKYESNRLLQLGLGRQNAVQWALSFAGSAEMANFPTWSEALAILSGSLGEHRVATLRALAVTSWMATQVARSWTGANSRGYHLQALRSLTRVVAAASRGLGSASDALSILEALQSTLDGWVSEIAKAEEAEISLGDDRDMVVRVAWGTCAAVAAVQAKAGQMRKVASDAAVAAQLELALQTLSKFRGSAVLRFSSSAARATSDVIAAIISEKQEAVAVLEQSVLLLAACPTSRVLHCMVANLVSRVTAVTDGSSSSKGVRTLTALGQHFEEGALLALFRMAAAFRELPKDIDHRAGASAVQALVSLPWRAEASWRAQALAAQVLHETISPQPGDSDFKKLMKALLRGSKGASASTAEQRNTAARLLSSVLAKCR